MSVTVAQAVVGQIDRFAKWRETIQAAALAGTDFWTRTDSPDVTPENEVYENQVSTVAMTDLDTAMANADFGDHSKIAAWFDRHLSWLTSSTTGSVPGLGYSSSPWDTWLAANALRVPYSFAELYYNRNQSRISPQFVFPKGTYAASGAISAVGLHKFGDVTRVAGAWPTVLSNMTDGALPTSIQGAGVILISEAGSTATALTCNVTLQDRVTAKAVAMTGLTLSANAQYIVGQEAVGGAGAAAGQKVVPVAATGAFTALDWVVIVEDTVCEPCQVASLVANTSLTMTDNLINTFTSAAYVIPLYTNVTGLSAFTNGTNDDVIQLYAKPDRIIAL